MFSNQLNSVGRSFINVGAVDLNINILAGLIRPAEDNNSLNTHCCVITVSGCNYSFTVVFFAALL